MPVIAVAGWALMGALITLLLRPMVARYTTGAAPPPRPPRHGVLEVIAALLFAVLAYRFGAGLELLAFSALAASCVPLAALDLIVGRLPNTLTATSYVAVFVPLVLDALLSGNGERLTRSLLSMLAILAIHGAMYATGAIAGGDLKLAGALAMALGWHGWTSVWTGLALGWLLGGSAVLGLKAVRNKSFPPTIPLGPFLVAGTLATVLALPP